MAKANRIREKVDNEIKVLKKRVAVENNIKESKANHLVNQTLWEILENEAS